MANSYPPVRRIIAGHDSAGKAIVESDTLLTPYDPLSNGPASAEVMGVTQVHRSRSFPVNCLEPFREAHGKPVPIVYSKGASCRVVDVPAHAEAWVHRTQSLDYALIMSKEAVLVLDDGKEVLLKQNDIVVQPGTNHGWKGVGDEPGRFFFCVVPAQKVRIGDTVLEQTDFPEPYNAQESDVGE